MIHFNGSIIGTNLIWELIRYDDEYIDDGITISFPLPIQLNEREAINFLKTHLPTMCKNGTPATVAAARGLPVRTKKSF